MLAGAFFWSTLSQIPTRYRIESTVERKYCVATLKWLFCEFCKISFWRRCSEAEAAAIFDALKNGNGMVQPSNLQDCSNFKNGIIDRFRPIERRLDLIHRYKKHFDQSTHLSQEQRDFINGVMYFDQLVPFVLRYELAIAEAIEIAEATAREARLSVLSRHVAAQSEPASPE